MFEFKYSWIVVLATCQLTVANFFVLVSVCTLMPIITFPAHKRHSTSIRDLYDRLAQDD